MRLLAWVGLSLALTATAQNLPPGTHSADDPTQQNAASQQVRDAETALEQGDYKSAETQLQALAAAKPHDAQLQYDLGFAEERNGKPLEAAKAYAAAVAADATLAQPKIALGLLDAREGRSEKAHSELLDAASMSGAAPGLRGKALRAMATLDQEKNPEAAREELIEALKLTPETPGDVQMAGELAESAGDPAAAETEYRKVLALRPGDVDATAGLAHVLTGEGKTAEAEQVLKAALEEHPDEPRLIARLATVYEAEGKAEQAIPLVEGLRAKADGNSEAGRAIGKSLGPLLAHLYTLAGRDADAEKLLLQLVTNEPKDAGLLDDLGGAQVKQGKFAAAEMTLAKAVAMRGSFTDDAAWGEAEGHLAFAAQKNNDPKLCLQALAARATVLPNTPASLFIEATAHDTLHQTKDAEQAYRAFLGLADGKFPDQEFEARHRLVALEHER